MFNWIVSNKQILTAIAAIAGLVTSVTGLVHAVKEPGAVKAYETLREASQNNSDNISKNHDDIIRLKTWIQELRKADEDTKAEVAKMCSTAPPVCMTTVPAASASAPINLKTLPPKLSAKPKSKKLPKSLDAL